MPSFAQSLEKTLHAALGNASERSHEYATLEHLLLALIDDPDAAQVMQACGVDLGDLGDVVRQYLDQEYQSLKTQDKADRDALADRPRNEEDRQLGPALPRDLQRLRAAEPARRDVGEDHVDLRPQDLEDEIPAGLHPRYHRVEAVGVELGAEPGGKLRVVVEEDNLRRFEG